MTVATPRRVDAAPDGAIDAGTAVPTSSALAGWVTVVAVAVAVATSGWAWSAIFADATVVALVAAGAVLGAVVGRSTLRWPLTVSLAGGGVIIVAGVALGAPHGLAVGGLLLASSFEYLAIPAAAAVVGAWWGVALLLRTAVSPAGLVVVAAVHTVASLYTIGQRSTSLLVAVVTVAALLAGWLAARLAGGADVRWRPAAVVGGGALLATGLVFAIDDGDGYDLRARLDPPLVVVDGTSPLSLVKAGLVENDPEPVFTVTLEGLDADALVDRIPVAMLDVYDGAVWSSSARFVPAGARLPSPEVAPSTGDEVDFRIELAEQFPFRQLPLPGVARRLDGEDLFWDSNSGMLTTAEVPGSGYAFGGVVALVPAAEPSGQPGGIGPALLPETLPPEIDAFATSALTGDDAAVWLDQLEAELRVRFGYSEEAPGGHSMAALARYLDGDRPGFAEQSTSAFAVVARRLQLPTRVVVGYRLDDPLTAEAPTAVVLEDAIDAWPEVWFEGVGWVAYDPTDRNNTAEPAAQSLEVSEAGQEAGEAAPPIVLDEPDFIPAEEERRGWRPPLWLTVIVAVPLVAAMLVRLAKRWRRRRRRRASDPATRVVGAWRETEDQLLDAGRLRRRGASVIDLRDRSGDDVGESLGRLAVRVDEAIYAPELPDEEAAKEAWASAGATLDAMKSEWGTRQRVRAALNPRSLVPRR